MGLLTLVSLFWNQTLNLLIFKDFFVILHQSVHTFSEYVVLLYENRPNAFWDTCNSNSVSMP